MGRSSEDRPENKGQGIKTEWFMDSPIHFKYAEILLKRRYFIPDDCRKKRLALHPLSL